METTDMNTTRKKMDPELSALLKEPAESTTTLKYAGAMIASQIFEKNDAEQENDSDDK